MRVVIFIFSISLFQFCIAQQALTTYSAGVGLSLSFTDAATAPGYGLQGAWHRKQRNNIGYGFELDIDRMFGGNKSSLLNAGKGYYFSSTVLSAIPTIDYTFALLRKDKLELKPSIGAGITYHSSKGGFNNPSEAIALYKEWERPYFEPVIKNGTIVDASTSSNTAIMSILPSFSLGYYVKNNIKLFLRVGYLIPMTDKLDAYYIPSASNKGNDIIQVTHFGFGYSLYKKKIFRPK